MKLEILTVDEVIEQLKRFDGKKLVYVDDMESGEVVGVRGVYRIESITRDDIDGQVYLGMVD